MNPLRIAIILLLVSCGTLIGGCSQENSGDEAAAGTSAVPLGLDRFLLFPNPIVETSGNFQTDTNAFAQAYYAAVDPFGQRTTLAAWKIRNQVGSGGQEFVAVFRDVRDLGYGRRMTGRRNADGSIAFFVENYNVANVPGSYSRINVDAAVVQDPTWHVGTNAIEWSPAECTASDPLLDCDIAVNFTKYFNFDPATGQRQNALNLDGRGQKSMPGICISCHGGRADPLTPDSTFALVENALSRKRGDVHARLQGFNVDSFEWSTTAGFTRADQESVLKIFNQWVLCSYPGGGSVTGTWGTCNRPAAGANEWQGTASALIENAYGGSALPNAQFSDTHLPAGWNTGATNVQLYRQVVVPYCRTCHLLRGSVNESDIDFDSEAKFRSYAARIKAHVFDRGNMPLAYLVYQDFWNSNGPSILASYIDSVLGAGTATTSSGAVKQPGRPIAEPGPNRMVRTGANARLYGGDSLFAASYSWTLDPPGQTAAITNPNSQTATFFSMFAGTYTVRLTVSNRGVSDTNTVTVTVDDAFRDPANLRFAHVKDVLQNGSTCTTCHLPRAVVQPAATPPIWYTDFDRNFSGGAGNAIDDDWFYSEIMGRVNLTEVGNSPLLRKPSDPAAINHHNGNTLFDLTTAGGLSNFSVIYNWILYGAQSGGVAANAGVDSTSNVAFAGAPATATIPLSGNGSIGATSYAWTIVSATAAVHPNGTPAAVTVPSISNANAATATLNVYDIGTYVVRLTVSNGTDTDVDDRTITVTDTAVVASASPTGTQSLSFTGSAPATATLNLSSAGTTGSPLAYSWTYDATGLLTGTCGTISNASSATATLTVPDTAIGSSCTFRLTAANLSTTAIDTTSITIAAAAGQNPTASYTATTTSRCSVSGGATATPSAACTWAGSPFNAAIGLSGSASGAGTLTYQWSVTAGPSGSTITNQVDGVGSSTATLNIVNDGIYTVQFFVDNGALSTGTTVTKTITVSANRTFAQVSAVFTGALACTGCHSYANGATNPDPAVNSGNAPSWANENDSNGKTLYQRVFDRVNLGSPASSLLVLNPLGTNVAPNANGHGGGQLFADENDSNYITFLTWIIGGAPP